MRAERVWAEQGQAEMQSWELWAHPAWLEGCLLPVPGLSFVSESLVSFVTPLFVTTSFFIRSPL